MGHLTREYEYNANLDRTTAMLDGRDMTITLRPTRRAGVGYRYEIGFFPHDEREASVVAGLTVGGLAELIAEMQRLGSGCFDRQWPRRVAQESYFYDPSNAAEITEWLSSVDDEHDDLTLDDLLGDPDEAPKQGPLETVGALMQHLEENYSASSRLNNVSVNADECVIRIG